jgi:hypothetical protein
MRRFSSTVSRVKIRRPSGTWTTPSPTIAAGARPSSDFPANSMMPSSMAPPTPGRTPDTARTSVVLPAPLLPSTATTPRSPTSTETSRSALTDPP